MVDGRCETCKWWGGPFYAYDGGPYEGMGECNLTAMEKHWQPTHGDSKAFGLAFKRTRAVLMTAPDFGCVQHEPKGEQ